MPSYTNKGQQAANRAQTSRRLATKAGQGRLSVSLGASDPRHRRNAQSAQATERQFFKGDFYTDKQGRLRLRK
jgi:hypothetical protein